MFEELTNQFEDAVKAFKGEAKISEENVDEALKQVRRALLDADVSLSVVKEFIEEVRVKAIGTEVVRGINPGQKFIQVVHEQLVNVMGGENDPLANSDKKPKIRGIILPICGSELKKRKNFFKIRLKTICVPKSKFLLLSIVSVKVKNGSAIQKPACSSNQ